MKILIVGSTGMLGGTAKNYFSNVETLDRNELDLSDCSYEQLAIAIDRKKCDFVINCAGLIKQRSVKEYQMIAINSVLPHKMSEICNTFGQKMFHITTDCVFDGMEGMYSETSNHNATDIYGISKSLGEPSDCMVIRTSIIGEEKKNKLSLLEWVKENKGSKIKGFTNHYWNGVTCLELCEVIGYIIKKDLYQQKLQHVFSNTVSKYELVNLINQIYNLDIDIEEYKTDQKCDRTLTTIHAKIETKSISEQIKLSKEFYEHIH
jgi:dTDP-4-dehydrorhamnose reductase